MIKSKRRPFIGALGANGDLPKVASKYASFKLDAWSTAMFLDDQVLTLPFRGLVYACCGLPLSAFVVCVLLSLTLHFDAATRTHCQVCVSSRVQCAVYTARRAQVTNWLPSISAAIGGQSPEKYIWSYAIALHCTPRFLIGFAYKNFYR
jgi:hypothetical protein